MPHFATCVFKIVCSNPLNMIATTCPLRRIWINQLTIGANCGNVSFFFFGLGFLKKKFREEEPVGRRKLDGKSEKAKHHKLLTSKHSVSIFVDSHHIRHSRTSSYPAWRLKRTTNSCEGGRQDLLQDFGWCTWRVPQSSLLMVTVQKNHQFLQEPKTGKKHVLLLRDPKR